MNTEINLTSAEEKLAILVWREAPLKSPDLVALAEKEMGWKKSTVYTVLKKLCDKGVFINEKANVAVALTREELRARQSHWFVEETFGGSLPSFITSFMGGKDLSPDQVAELKQLIDEHDSGDGNE